MFLTAVWTLILMAPIHCRGIDVMFNFADEELNQSTYFIYNWAEHIFIFFVQFWNTKKQQQKTIQQSKETPKVCI